MSNVYYNPADCGISVFEVLDESNLSYEFNTLLVVEEISSKRLFYCQSSGCSCPTPFEEFYFRNGDDNDLEEIKQENIEQFISSVDSFPVTSDERQELIRKVKNHLKK